jgi:hypothetical protein
MGIEKGIITESVKRDSSLSDAQQLHPESFLFRHVPLLLCLLLALIIRAWLVYHTHGVIDGDEAMVGIQAQHILRGELPVYFFSQAYMGSLEAYLMALLLLSQVPLYGHCVPNLFCFHSCSSGSPGNWLPYWQMPRSYLPMPNGAS